MEPNQENIRKWVDALRSGEYEQGTGALVSKHELAPGLKHCCLGVACETAGLWPNGWRGSALHLTQEGTYGKYGNGCVLPYEVEEWLGLPNNPRLASGEWVLDCTTANDDLGWSFDQIADAIEETYLKEEA